MNKRAAMKITSSTAVTVMHGTGKCGGDERCDSYFTYCLRPFGESQLNTSRCSSAQIISSTNKNDGPLDFFQSTVLGLNNPQNLSGLEGADNVSHYFLYSVTAWLVTVIENSSIIGSSALY